MFEVVKTIIGFALIFLGGFTIWYIFFRNTKLSEQDAKEKIKPILQNLYTVTICRFKLKILAKL